MEYKKLQELKTNKTIKYDLFAIIIFAFAGIFISALSLMDLLVNDLIFFILLLPFIIIPSLFAFHYLLLYRNEYPKLSFGVFWTSIKMYFTEQFSGCYHIVKTILKGLIYYILSVFVSILLINLPLYNSNVFFYKDFIDELASIMETSIDYELIINYINQHIETFNLISITVNALPFVVVSTYFICAFSRNSVSIIAKNELNKYNGKYLNIVLSNAYRKNKFEYFKADLYLNYPAYIGYFLMMGLGGYIGYIYKPEPVSIFTFAMTFAIFTYIAVFGAFRFRNKIVLYEYFKNEIRQGDMELQSKLINNFTTLFKNKSAEEEDTKKDSDES